MMALSASQSSGGERSSAGEPPEKAAEVAEPSLEREVVTSIVTGKSSVGRNSSTPEGYAVP